MKAVIVLALAISSFVAATACTKTNPNTCCTTQEDCDEHGIPLGTSCAAGLICTNNLCVDASCQADSDCAAPTGHCSSDHVCVECDANAQCSSGACDLATHACVECFENSHCMFGVCDTSKQLCVECLENSDCTSGACDTTKQMCVECLSNTQCPAGACDTTRQVCVECLDSTQCSNGVCNTTSQMCVQCLGNGDCLTGACDTSSHTCVNCNNNTQCASGACDTNTHMCLECSTNAQCGSHVCSPSNACVACTADAQCTSGLCDTGTGNCLGASSIIPRFLPAVCATAATSMDLVISTSTSLSTDDASTCNGGVVTQTNGPDICVIRHRKIQVASAATVTVVGARAAAFVADADVTIAGTVDVSANTLTDGPGGGFANDGTSVGANGGGGAGFATRGGAGGNGSQAGGASNSGPPRTSPSATGILMGGPRTSNSGGGGALALISCRAKVLVSGTLHAGGAGGGPGGLSGTSPIGARGGGAGGYAVLQGIDVAVTGRLFANGGAGGSGRPTNAPKGELGPEGTLSDTTPALGPPSTASNGAGGNGAYGAVLPRDGGPYTNAAASAGGGGGSVGFLQTCTASGHAPTLNPAAISPAFSANITLSTQ